MLSSKSHALCFVAIALLLTVSGSASAAPRTYTYTIEHPPYGVIGTYTDTVDQTGEARRIDTTVRVAVRILGIVLYRQEADRTETWLGDRLVSFRSTTTVNGKTIEVRGEACSDGFVVTTPSGTVTAPSHIYTASPWSAGLPRPETMVVPENGRVERAQVTGGGIAISSIHGARMPVHQYEIVSHDRYYVWSSLEGVPLRFGIQGDGSATDFVLRSEDVAAITVGQR